MDALIAEERKKQKRTLLERWCTMRKDQVLRENFYVFSFQSYFEFPDEEGYQPCELAIVEYSLHDGITRQFHAMINPGRVVLGLGAEAKLWSERTHKIPTVGFELGRTDHDVLWREVLEFVNPRGDACFPPLYTRISEEVKNTRCLEYLARLAGQANRLSKVYQFENLAHALYDHAKLQIPSLNLIKEGCGSSLYDYECDTKCDYHDEIECLFCAVLTVKKCCFWMSDAFMKVFKIEITERHLPVRQLPRYDIIAPEDMVVHKYTGRSKFLGAASLPAYDPNLPSSLQPRQSFRDAYRNTSAVGDDDDDDAFASRDVRYRGNKKVSAGRGLTMTFVPSAAFSKAETVSVADTVDDVASTILEDDMQTLVLADEEISEATSCVTNMRLPRRAGRFVQQALETGPCRGDSELRPVNVAEAEKLGPIGDGDLSAVPAHSVAKSWSNGTAKSRFDLAQNIKTARDLSGNGMCFGRGRGVASDNSSIVYRSDSD